MSPIPDPAVHLEFAPRSSSDPRRHAHRVLWFGAGLLLSSCSTVGSLMSPYSERFSCRNPDHGQCIHPERAYEDAVEGATSRSDPAVTRDRALLRDQARAARGRRREVAGAYQGYRDSVFAELKGLIDAPVTPMLQPARTIRTLILPYAERQRPDRLYMPRYIYSILDRPAWVVGSYLVTRPSRAAQAPILGQVHEPPNDERAAAPSVAEPRP
jgi:conjugal transfer pilus assembly protein TraV